MAFDLEHQHGPDEVVDDVVGDVKSVQHLVGRDVQCLHVVIGGKSFLRLDGDDFPIPEKVMRKVQTLCTIGLGTLGNHISEGE